MKFETLNMKFETLNMKFETLNMKFEALNMKFKTLNMIFNFRFELKATMWSNINNRRSNPAVEKKVFLIQIVIKELNLNTKQKRSTLFRESQSYFAEDFEEYADEIKDELASLPPFEMIGWFQYEALTTDFQIDPNTDAVAVAVARNSNGEWGEFTIVPFTTPSEVSDAPNYKANNSNKILERNKAVEQKPVFEKGKVPTIKKRNKIELK